jgi:uncharacterized protein
MASSIIAKLYALPRFGWIGAINRAEQAGSVVAIYCSQFVIAPLWLRYFRFGPLEWVWRRMTYGKFEPFRR